MCKHWQGRWRRQQKVEMEATPAAGEVTGAEGVEMQVTAAVGAPGGGGGRRSGGRCDTSCKEGGGGRKMRSTQYISTADFRVRKV